MKKVYLDFLDSLSQFRVKLGLDNTRQLLKLVGNSEKEQKFVHIAGTNGKGSTIITLERLLIDSGYRVATTISPHLILVNERFRYQAKSISDNDLEKLFLVLFEACKIAKNNINIPDKWSFRPTYFETIIVLFILWAKKLKVDYTLLETGLGGRLDATNVIKPVVTAITAISYDHQKILGNSLIKITNEKLGIAKKNVALFVAKQKPIVNSYIRNSPVQVKKYFYNSDFGYLENDFIHEKTFYYAKDKKFVKISRLNLIGDYQWENAATALGLYFHLINKNTILTEKKINQSLQKVNWLGRLSYISTHPKILIDAAHNRQGVCILIDYLLKNHLQDKILFALSWMADKRLDHYLKNLAHLNINFLPLSFDNQRAETAKNIESKLINNRLSVLNYLDLNSFVSNLKQGSYKKYDLILIAGSIYLIGNFLKDWSEIKK